MLYFAPRPASCVPVRMMQIDQAALTGESLPVKKHRGDVAFAGSTIKQGERHAVVSGGGGLYCKCSACYHHLRSIRSLALPIEGHGCMGLSGRLGRNTA